MSLAVMIKRTEKVYHLLWLSSTWLMVEESVWLETVEKTAKQKAKFEDSGFSKTWDGVTL